MQWLKGLRNDFKLIRRDMILMMLLVFVIYLGVVLRFLLPWLNGYLMEKGFLPNAKTTSTLATFYPIILSFLIIYTGPMLGGAIFGNLILSDKDDQTLKALMVTPVSPNKYVGRRTMISAILSFFIILFVFYCVGIDLLPLWQMVLIAIGGALTAPIIMLFLGIFAESKLQGLSYSKFLSFGGFLVILSWFVRSDLQYLFGLFPPYWVSKAYWSASTGGMVWLLYLLIGIAFQIITIQLLHRQFIKRIYTKLS